MQQRLALAFLFTLGVLILEVVGGLLSGSLALLTDAGHVFTDVVALGLSWYGVKQTERPSNYRMTYGYHRVGIFIAFINAALLLGIAIAVLVEASRRFMEPRPVDGELMSVVALLGLAVNGVVLAGAAGAPAQPEPAQRISPRGRRRVVLGGGDHRRRYHPIHRLDVG